MVFTWSKRAQNNTQHGSQITKTGKGFTSKLYFELSFFGFIISYLVKFEGERQNIVKLSVLLKKGNLQKEQNVYV